MTDPEGLVPMDPVRITVPSPATPVEPVVPAPEPEPFFVVVDRDEVEAYASMGYRPGYVMLKP